jgi:hypothetical protein
MESICYNPYPEETISFNSFPKDCPLHQLSYGILSELIVPKVSEIQTKERERIIHDTVYSLGPAKMKYYLLKLYHEDKEHKIINLKNKVSSLNNRKNIIKLIKEQEIPCYYLLKIKKEYENRPKLKTGDHIIYRECNSNTIIIKEGIYSHYNIDELCHTVNDRSLRKDEERGWMHNLKLVDLKRNIYDPSDYEVSCGITDRCIDNTGDRVSIRGLEYTCHVYSWMCEVLPHDPELHSIRERNWVQALKSHNYHHNLWEDIFISIKYDERYTNLGWRAEEYIEKIILSNGYDPLDKNVWENMQIILHKPRNIINQWGKYEWAQYKFQGIPCIIPYKNYFDRCQDFYNSNNGYQLLYEPWVKSLEFLIEWMKQYLY